MSGAFFKYSLVIRSGPGDLLFFSFFRISVSLGLVIGASKMSSVSGMLVRAFLSQYLLLSPNNFLKCVVQESDVIPVVVGGPCSLLLTIFQNCLGLVVSFRDVWILLK